MKQACGVQICHDLPLPLLSRKTLAASCSILQHCCLQILQAMDAIDILAEYGRMPKLPAR